MSAMARNRSCWRTDYLTRRITTGLAIVLIAQLNLATAPAATIDANCFKYTPGPNQPQPTCLEITVGNNNKFDDKADPTNMFKAANGTMSAGFPNREGKGTTKATLSGVMLPAGSEVCVKFVTTGTKPAPSGQFTAVDAQGRTVNVGGVVKSKSLDGITVSYVPSGGGFDATLDVTNDFGADLIGSVDIYVNTGFSSFFNVDDFDTLHAGARLIASFPNFSLAHGESLTTFTTSLNSAEEFLLLIGAVDAGDGSGPSPFAYADSPVRIPEPSAIALLCVAAPLLPLTRRVRFRKSEMKWLNPSSGGGPVVRAPR